MVPCEPDMKLRSLPMSSGCRSDMVVFHLTDMDRQAYYNADYSTHILQQLQVLTLIINHIILLQYSFQI